MSLANFVLPQSYEPPRLVADKDLHERFCWAQCLVMRLADARLCSLIIADRRGVEKPARKSAKNARLVHMHLAAATTALCLGSAAQLHEVSKQSKKLAGDLDVSPQHSLQLCSVSKDPRNSLHDTLQPTAAQRSFRIDQRPRPPALIAPTSWLAAYSCAPVAGCAAIRPP